MPTSTVIPITSQTKKKPRSTRRRFFWNLFSTSQPKVLPHTKSVSPQKSPSSKNNLSLSNNPMATRGGKWSLKYKRSIDCNHPRGFSQKQHCKYGRRKTYKVKK